MRDAPRLAFLPPPAKFRRTIRQQRARSVLILPCGLSKSTGRRSCGGPAIMIMRPVNSSVVGRGMRDIGGVPAITGTEARRFPPPWSLSRARAGIIGTPVD
jgi:hypothetical protein